MRHQRDKVDLGKKRLTPLWKTISRLAQVIRQPIVILDPPNAVDARKNFQQVDLLALHGMAGFVTSGLSRYDDNHLRSSVDFPSPLRQI